MGVHSARVSRRWDMVAVAALGGVVIAITLLVGFVILPGARAGSGPTQLMDVSHTSGGNNSVPFDDQSGR